MKVPGASSAPGTWGITRGRENRRLKDRRAPLECHAQLASGRYLSWAWWETCARPGRYSGSPMVLLLEQRVAEGGVGDLIFNGLN